MRQRSNLIILFGIAFFLVGGAIVFLVLNDEDDGGPSASAADGVAEVSVLVAAEDIPANTIGSDAIEKGLLATEQISSASQPAGALTSADLLQNRIFAVDVSKGSAITSGQLATRSLSNIPIPEGFDGVAVTVEYTPGGAGYIAPGDMVNVYGLYGDNVSDGGLASGIEIDGTRLPRTELALTNVRVLGVSEQQQSAAQAAASSPTTAPAGTLNRQQTERPLTYLLAVRPADAERIIHLNEYASIYLTLTADGAGPAGDTPGVGGENVNDPVSAASAAPQS